jgi:lactoylglutathione lyase
VAINGVSLVGICVSDLERSLRFYCDGLGFILLRSYEIAGDSWGRVMGVEAARAHSRVLRRTQISVELLYFESPGHVGSPTVRPLNQLGLTHLAVWVDDIDEEIARLIALGGGVVENTFTVFDEPGFSARWVYCSDPDGTRIELIEHPAGAAVAFGD